MAKSSRSPSAGGHAGEQSPSPSGGGQAGEHSSSPSGGGQAGEHAPSPSGGGQGGGSVTIYDAEGKETGQLELPQAIFDVPVNAAVLHQAVLRQEANDRQGTTQTKTRGDVSGGGKKPWKQKGTGRARQGSTRAPQWRHGGVVFGPHPRSYDQKMPRKQRRLALRAALSAKTREGVFRVVEEIVLEEPRTRVVADLFTQLGAGARTLFVIPEHDLMLEKSARNLVTVKTVLAQNLSVEDVLMADTIVMSRTALALIEEWLS